MSVRLTTGEFLDRRLTVKRKEACRALGMGTTRLHELIVAKELESFTSGRSRLITAASIVAYVQRCQSARPSDGRNSPALAASVKDALFWLRRDHRRLLLPGPGIQDESGDLACRVPDESDPRVILVVDVEFVA